MNLSELASKSARCCKLDQNRVCLHVQPHGIRILARWFWDPNNPEYEYVVEASPLTQELLDSLPQDWRVGTVCRLPGENGRWIIIDFGDPGATPDEVQWISFIPEGLIQVDI